MYINGDFRSKKKKKNKKPWNHNIHKGERNMGSNETYGPSVCTYHFQLIYLVSFNINSFQSQTCTEDLG